MRTFTDDERRARLARRHRLLPGTRTDDVAAITADLLAVHSSDPATVFLTLFARMEQPTHAAVEAALYDDRTLVRAHAMRRTLWVAEPPTMALMQVAATRKVAANERRMLLASLAHAGLSDPEQWLTDATGHVLAALHEHGPLNTRRLGELVPELGLKIETSPGNPKTAVVSAHAKVLSQAGFDGLITRARPSGSWNASHYVWHATDAWLGEPWPEIDADEACRDLADAWLRRFGPATATDLQWWMGWTKTITTKALKACGAEEVRLAGDVPGYVAEGDTEPEPKAEKWVAVLPSLDATTMGWKQRAWYLADHASDAFDTFGNAGPTLWVDGQVVGAWAQRKDGDLASLYFTDVPAGRRRQLDRRLAEVRAWLGDTVVTERFPGLARKTLLSGS